MVEYQEIVKKDGRRIVFCRFEDLLKEAFNASSMEEVQSHQNPNGQFICHCPFCRSEGHTKKKLYIKDDLSVGHCFVCTRAFINVIDDVDVSYKLPGFIKQSQGLNLVRLSDPDWSLDRYYNEFDDFDEKGYEYLIKRHGFMKDLYKLLEFKFIDGNIVMPFKYHQEIFYYQIRFSGKSKIKYYFPPIAPGAKPPYIIENGDNKKFIICEGVYDAISLLLQAPGYTPMAVLGSCITDYQIEFLREYVPEKILIYMDETKISIRIANKLKSIIDYCPIGIIKSDGTDPEENMKIRMMKGYNLQWIN